MDVGENDNNINSENSIALTSDSISETIIQSFPQDRRIRIIDSLIDNGILKGSDKGNVDFDYDRLGETINIIDHIDENSESETTTFVQFEQDDTELDKDIESNEIESKASEIINMINSVLVSERIVDQEDIDEVSQKLFTIRNIAIVDSGPSNLRFFMQRLPQTSDNSGVLQISKEALKHDVKSLEELFFKLGIKGISKQNLISIELTRHLSHEYGGHIFEKYNILKNAENGKDLEDNELLEDLVLERDIRRVTRNHFHHAEEELYSTKMNVIAGDFSLNKLVSSDLQLLQITSSERIATGIEKLLLPEILRKNGLEENDIAKVLNYYNGVNSKEVSDWLKLVDKVESNGIAFKNITRMINQLNSIIPREFKKIGKLPKIIGGMGAREWGYMFGMSKEQLKQLYN